MTEAYVTLFFGGLPLEVAETMLRSLRAVDARRPIVLLTLDDADDADDADAEACDRLRRRFAPLHVHRVPRLRGTGCRGTDAARFALQRRASEDAARTVFSSFHAFNLTSYARVLWVELDQLVLRPLEPLWRLPLPATAAAAAAAVLTEGCATEYEDAAQGANLSHARKYNTGVVLLAPNRTDFAALLEAMHTRSYTCTDGFQTLWNRVLARRTVCVHHTYNCIEHQRAAFAPRCLLPNASTPHVVHFAGASKPWLQPPSDRARQSAGYAQWRRYRYSR